MFALNLMCFGQPRAASQEPSTRPDSPENLGKTRTKYAMHKDRELPYLAFRLVFRAGAAIRNVARSVQAIFSITVLGLVGGAPGRETPRVC